MINPTQTIAVRPGILVSLSTRVQGGVAYIREDLGKDRTDSVERTEWRTERIIDDVEEFERAQKVRSKISSLVRSACAWTPFGLICPQVDVERLNEVMAEAYALMDEFNATAQHSKVRFTHIRGTIAANDAEAIAAVRSEISDLLAELHAATQTGDVGGIRDVANRVTQIDKLLEQESNASQKLAKAISAARKTAREIVKRVEKEGEEIAAVLAEADLKPIATARFLFDESTAYSVDGADQHPSVSLNRFADLVD